MAKVPPVRRIVRAAMIGVALLAAPGLTACSTGDDVTLSNVPENLAVDAFLWQGAIDTLAFTKLAVADPATGRIETVWGATNVAGRESRAIVQIYPGDLSANSVAVEVHIREGGVERGIDVQASGTVQEAIFLRARQIRASIDDN